ncbi:hypothetical protein EDB85DRAFT_1896332 [Lactarius pseudohatsudake]|nr:hypothetical protein EDB85DRAFT_1896332 [Lactarius pseudohatsudake]
MISIVDPTIQTSTADIPSPSLAAASTLKRVEEISTVLTADELSPQQLSKSIDQTTDDDDNDDWSSFAPCTSAPPPRNPRRPFCPRASPIASILDSVKPVNEQPPPPRNTCRLASPIVPVTTRDESSDPPLPLIETPNLSTTASAAQHAENRPVATPIEVDHGETLVTSPHASNGTARKRKRIHAQLARRRIPLPQKCRYVQRHPAISPPPVDDSSGLFTPVRLLRSSPSVRLTAPRRALLLDAIPLPLPSRSFPDTVDLAEDDKFSPPALSPLHFILSEDDLKGAIQTPTFALYLRSSTAASPRTSFKNVPVRPPLDLSLALDELPLNSSSTVVNLTRDMINGTANTVLFASPPPSPSVAPTFSPAHPPISIVEDDNLSKRGVKTSKTSVLAPDIASSKSISTRVHTKSPIPRYPPIFLPRAFEQLRDPDEVAPNTTQRISQHPRASAAGTTSRPSNSTTTRNRDRHTNTTHCIDKTTTHALREPAQHDRYRPYPRIAQPPSQPSHPSRRAPSPADRRIKDERPPDAIAKRRKVDKFLKNYNVSYPSKKTAPKPPEPEYDAVTRHLNYKLRISDVPNRLDPFHYTVLQLATMGPDGTQPRSIYRSKVNTRLFEDE